MDAFLRLACQTESELELAVARSPDCWDTPRPLASSHTVPTPPASPRGESSRRARHRRVRPPHSHSGQRGSLSRSPAVCECDCAPRAASSRSSRVAVGRDRRVVGRAAQAQAHKSVFFKSRCRVGAALSRSAYTHIWGETALSLVSDHIHVCTRVRKDGARTESGVRHSVQLHSWCLVHTARVA